MSSENIAAVMVVPSAEDEDLVREFFAAVRSRPCGAVISLIEANPGLICSVEDADSGDTALHVAVKACRSGDVYMANMYEDGWTTNQGSHFARQNRI